MGLLAGVVGGWRRAVVCDRGFGRVGRMGHASVGSVITGNRSLPLCWWMKGLVWYAHTCGWSVGLFLPFGVMLAATFSICIRSGSSFLISRGSSTLLYRTTS